MVTGLHSRNRQALEPDPMPKRLAFGRCELRLDSRELRVAGVRRPLRRRVFDLLVFLVLQRPRVVTHAELMRAVWQHTNVTQPVLARAVMEARRACGDDGDEPRLIVSVHAVGYRFAGEVSSSSSTNPSSPAATEPTEAAVDEVRALVRSARLAIFEHRLEQARRLADEALSRAIALGVRSEQVRALLACSSHALHCGQIAEAAGLAQQALRIAQREGFEPLVAEAGMALGGLHVLAGDRDTGMRHLRDAMQVFSQPGQEVQLRSCLNWMALAMREQGELELGLQLCRRGIALQMSAAGGRLPIVDRLNELQLLIELGDRDAATRVQESAHDWYRQALAACLDLLPVLEDPELGVLRAACLSQQAVALERLDRLDEACQVAAECDGQRERLSAAGRAWPDATNRAVFRVQRARLLARTGRPQQALAALHDALVDAEAAETSASLVNLYRIAADVAILAGDHRKASQWLRAQCDAVVSTQRNRGASMAAILAAELNIEGLQADLGRARSELRERLAENARLYRRMRQLQGRVPALDSVS